ncbi:hypothetical protein ABZW18_21590 [Streptomyces sp. NPDC004647]|uniref:hypothetical protein n=1 Tax=Streptomyces sp. NPDC004647 TaxID=3154671 RepID=UPI0033A6E319
MARNALGSAVALIGATAAVLSPFRVWYNGREGRDIRVEDLFGGITSVDAALWTSMLLPMVFAAVVTLLGVLFRSRLLVTVAGVVVLGFTVVWMVRQGQAAGSLVAGGELGLGSGAALAVGGGLLILLGAVLMSGRRRRRSRHGRQEPGPYEPGPDDHEPGPYGHEPEPYGPSTTDTQPIRGYPPPPPPPDDPWRPGRRRSP